MIQRSDYYTDSITQAASHEMWTPEERSSLIATEERVRRKALVAVHRGAGYNLTLTTND